MHPSLAHGTLEVRHEAVAVRPGENLHELPTVRAPLVKDRLGGMHDERNGRVFPGGGHAWSLIPDGAPGPAVVDYIQERANSGSTAGSPSPSSTSCQDRIWGERRSRARRSRSVIPPHTPKSIRLSSASARHSIWTGQPRHRLRASRWAAPSTKRASGALRAQRARAAQWDSSITADTVLLSRALLDDSAPTKTVDVKGGSWRDPFR